MSETMKREIKAYTRHFHTILVDGETVDLRVAMPDFTTYVTSEKVEQVCVGSIHGLRGLHELIGEVLADLDGGEQSA